MGDRDRPDLPLSSTAWRLGLIAAAAILPFLIGVRAGFIFDDLANLFQNPALADFDLGRYLTDPTAFSVKPGNWPYRPFTLMVSAVIHAVFGLDSAAPWRLVQIALHGANSLLVFALARKAFRLEGGAMIAALLFALSPLASQAVLYLSARGVTQATTLALAAVWLQLEAQDVGGRGRAIAFTAGALALAALAFLSYEGALVLTGWMIIAAWARQADFKSRRVLMPLLGAAVLAAAYLAVRALVSPSDLLEGHQAIRPALSRFDQVLLQLRTPGLMLRLFLLPTGLSFIREPSPSFTVLELALAALLAAAAAVLAALGRQRALAGGLAWHLFSLLPAALVPLNTPWAEHRAYLALPGLAVAAAALLEPALKLHGRKGWAARAAVLTILALFTLGSFHRAGQWAGQTRLLADAARKGPDSPVAWSFLAADAQARGDCRRALPFLAQALTLAPDFADAHNTRAVCLVEVGRPSEAVAAAARAVELDQENPYYWRNFALALDAAGETGEARRVLQSLLDNLPPQHPLRPVVEQDWRRIDPAN